MLWISTWSIFCCSFAYIKWAKHDHLLDMMLLLCVPAKRLTRQGMDITRLGKWSVLSVTNRWPADPLILVICLVEVLWTRLVPTKTTGTRYDWCLRNLAARMTAGTLHVLPAILKTPCSVARCINLYLLKEGSVRRMQLPLAIEACTKSSKMFT